MKEKIELREIVGYVPYSLKCKFDKEIYTIVGFVDENVYLKEMTYPSDLFLCKPILRPISSISTNQKSLLSDYDQSQIGNFLYDNNKLNVSLVDRMTYTGIVYLLRNHFDIHGLIERGLAIDINNIKS